MLTRGCEAKETIDTGSTLLTSLPQIPALEFLDFCANQIKRVGAVALAKAAVSRPSLQQLLLDENTISEEGLEEVGERGVDDAASQYDLAWRPHRSRRSLLQSPRRSGRWTRTWRRTMRGAMMMMMVMMAVMMS